MLYRNGTAQTPFQPGINGPLDWAGIGVAGTYTIKATNPTNGVSVFMNNSCEVVVNPLPLAYMLVPQGDTCYGTEVLLNGSELGINYYLLRGTDTLSMVAGTGLFGLLSFGHIYDTGTLHAVGINPLTGCKTDMLGTVNLQPAPVVFNVIPPGILCPGETVLVTGSQLGILYQLRRDSLINVGPPVAGTGALISFGAQYLPGKYQVIGYNPLTHCYSWMNGNATIQVPPAMFSMLPSGDTCAPAMVRLNGSQIGISYRLVLNNTILLDSLYGTGSPLLFGTYQTGGVYKIIAIDTLTHCEYWMSDSLRIFAAPIKYNILPNGIACANSVIWLDNSQIGVSYTLLRDGWIIAAGPIPGTGSPLSFGNQSEGGTYTIEAVTATTLCHTMMNGSTLLQPIPTLFTQQPPGNQCAGTTLYLSGSQVGVTYTLLRDLIIQSTLAGTGSMLDFGPQWLPGVYTIKAVYNITTCDTVMSGTTTIVPGPLVFALSPQGINCSPAIITLTSSQVGISYQLRLDSLTNVGTPMAGTGAAISFPPQSQSGVYSVVAHNIASDCYGWMSGRVTIQPPAVSYNIMPPGDTCAPALVRQSGSQTGKRYILMLNSAIKLDSVMGTGLPLVFGSYITSGVYRILCVDTASRCQRMMNDSLRIFDAPTAFNVIPAGLLCTGTDIGLDGSQAGVNYTLIRDGVTVVSGPIPGSGGPIWFGMQYYGGSYTVEAVSTLTTCHAVMPGTAVLNPRPISFLTQPQGTQCPGTDIYLNGSQSGINYQLLRDNILVATMSGSGTVIHFGAQYLTGVYTIRAVSPTTTCDTLMSGSTTIVSGPLAFNVTPAGANCSPTVVGLSGSQTGVEYQLYRNGFAVGPPMMGSGLAISFGAQTEGTYLVIAKTITTLCSDTMPGMVTITPGPIALAGADTSVCATHTLQLSGHASAYSTVLWTTLGDGAFSNPLVLSPVYTPGTIDMNSGQVRLVLTAHGTADCMNLTVSDTMVVSINARPMVDAGLNDTICPGQSAVLSASMAFASTAHWTSSGDGTFDNAIVLNPVYTPGVLDKISGLVTLTLSVHGTMSCIGDSVTDFMMLHLEPLPIATAGADDTICQSMTYRLSGSAQHSSALNWTTMGDGTFDNPAMGDATYTPGANDKLVGSVRLILSASGLAHCSTQISRDTIRLWVNPLPMVNVGPDTVICASEIYHATATLQHYSDHVWTTSGDGTFSNIHVVSPDYTPGPLDILIGSVWLKLSAHGQLGCATELNADSLLLSLSAVPVANAGADTLSCPNLAIPLHGSATHYMAALWSTTGDGTFDNASLITPNYTPGPADISAGQVDLTLTVNGLLQCGAITSTDTVRITFKPLPSVTLSGTSPICQGLSSVIALHLTGVGPWTVTYSDGTGNFTIANIPSSPYNLVVSPSLTTTYTILSVSDALCSFTHTGPSFTVVVNPSPSNFGITSSGSGYCAGGSGVQIGITGSQTGIFYQLLLGGAASGLPMPGTGSPVSFGYRTAPGVYQVKAYHGQTLCERIFSDSLVVVVYPAPLVDFTGDSTCLGQPTVFHLSGADISKIATWVWNFGDGNSVSYTAPIEPTHLYGSSGNFLASLLVTDTNGCTKTLVHQVTVSSLPVALFSHDAPLCTGFTVHFTDNSFCTGNNYLVKWHWEFGDGTDTTIYWPGPSAVTHIYALPSTYDVTLTVTTNRGCTAQKIRPVMITPGPAANFAYTNACEKQNVSFTDISQLNGGGSVVEWSWNFGDPLSGVNNSATTQSALHVFSSAGTYEVRLIVMNSGGCVDTIKKNVTVKTGPKAMFTYTTACLGSATQFTDTSTPNAGSNIEWTWDFGDGSPGSTSQNPSHIFASAGIYPVKLTVKNSNFCSHDTTMNVTVVPPPAAGFTTNTPQCNGSSVVFTNTSTTLHGMIVRWVWEFGDGTDTTILLGGIPNVTHIYSGTATQYTARLTVKTSDSCTAFTEHLIVLSAAPLASFDNSTTLCAGVNVQFTDLSQSGGGGPITLWHWNFGDPLSGSFNISTLSSPVHAFSGPGTFNVKMIITNAGGCKDSLTRVVVIQPLPVAAFTFDTVCAGSVTHFTDLSSTAAPGTLLTWDWDFGDGQPHANTANPSHLYTTAGPFTVTLTVMNSGYCVGTKTRVVHLSPVPLALFSNSSINCSGSNVTFTDQSSTTHGYILRWEWNFGDGNDTVIHFPGMSPVNHIYATGGTYTVTLSVKTSDSCSSSVSNIITVYNQPVANFSFSSSACQGTPVQFTDLSQPNGSGPVNGWNWNFGDPLSGTNNFSTLQNPVHSFMASGTFDVKLIIKNAYQCYDTIVKTITISANPVANFIADTVCKGTPTMFTDTSTSTSGTISGWTWNFGDGTAVSTQQDPIHLYANSGTYTVTLSVVTTMGCVHDTSHQVVVKVTPVANFSSSSHCKGSLTQFTDLSSTATGTISSREWNFGDGSPVSTAQNPTHLYALAGTYSVKLKVINSVGCTDSISLPVVIFNTPTAGFSYFSTNCPAGKVTFTDHSVPAGAAVTGWNWTLAPNSYSTSPNPVYTYSTTGTNQLIRLIVQDTEGCYDTIDSTIYIKPGFAFTFNSPPSCLGTPSQFQPVNLAAGDTLSDLHWTFGEPASGSSNYSTLYAPTHTYMNPGTYIVKLRAYNADNCQDSVFKEITVHGLPLVKVTYNPGAHCDSTITFTNLSSGNGAVLDSLRWVFGDGATLTSLPPIPSSVTHRYSGFGLFNAVVTAYNHFGCQATDTIGVNVACIASSFTNSDTAACQNTRVVFTDGSSPVSLIQSWRWLFGDGKDTTYTKHAGKISHTYSATGTYVVSLIVAAQSGGATIRDTSTLTIVVKTSPIALFNIASVCSGDSSRFINLSDSGGVPISSVLWNFGDPGSGVLDTSSRYSPVHRYLAAGKHTATLVMANGLGCSDTLRKTAMVHKLPQAAFSNSTPCQRYDIQFLDKSKTGDTALSLWWWYMGDAHNIYDTLYTRNTTYRYDSVGTFYTYLKVQDSFGCSDTTYAPVTVLPSPIAAFTVTEDIDGKPGKIRLNNHSSDDAKGFKWTFGNGKTSNEVSPVVTYTSDGQTYTIELVTWNAGLCYDTTLMSYEFLFDNLFVPNAFSPTNLSDAVGCREFRPKGMNLRDYDVMVFDKWGHLLWESKLLTDDGKGMPAQGWDGTFNGQLMPQDVYMWKISATFKNGKVWEGSDSGTGSTTTMGTVTLIR